MKMLKFTRKGIHYLRICHKKYFIKLYIVYLHLIEI